MHFRFRSAKVSHFLFVLFWLFVTGDFARTFEIKPASSDNNEEFENIANSLQPGDELILRGGVYSQEARRSITVKGTAEKPIIIRAADGEDPTITRPFEESDPQNNIEFVNCEYLTIRGLHFKGGSSGVRFIRGHQVTFEDCEVFETQNNAITLNSGDCDHFVIRRNHIHHTGLSMTKPTEGEGMYIGCHDGKCRATDSLFEGNYIHHTRSTSAGGNDGIEIKFRSSGNMVRNNVIHDTNIGTKYPGVFVYGGGDAPNIVEGNAIWNAGEGIQVVSDAIVRNNIIFDCLNTGISAAPHAAMPHVRNTTIIHNTIYNCPVGVRMRWAESTNSVFANNAIYCAGATAFDAKPGSALLHSNYASGSLSGITFDRNKLFDGGDPAAVFVDPTNHNFWPRPGSTLRGHAEVVFGTEADFNGAKRIKPIDVGAYESNDADKNPGWEIQAGFKR